MKPICDILFGNDVLTWVMMDIHQRGEKDRKNLAHISDLLPDFTIDKAILVDDKVENGKHHPDKIYVIKPFHGEQDDDLLNALEAIVPSVHCANWKACRFRVGSRRIAYTIPENNGAFVVFAKC